VRQQKEDNNAKELEIHSHFPNILSIIFEKSSFHSKIQADLTLETVHWHNGKLKNGR